MRIIQSFTLLPLGSVITRVPWISFEKQVVVKAVRNSPQFVSVAPDSENPSLVIIFSMILLSPSISRPPLGLSIDFHRWSDYILSGSDIVAPAHLHLVSEPNSRGNIGCGSSNLLRYYRWVRSLPEFPEVVSD